MNSGSCSPQVPSVSESGFSGNLSYAYPFEADVFRMAVELVECLYFRQPFLLTVFKQSRYPHQDSLDLPQVSGVAHLSPNQTFSLASFLLLWAYSGTDLRALSISLHQEMCPAFHCDCFRRCRDQKEKPAAAAFKPVWLQ